MRFLLKLFGEESAMGRFLNRLYIVIVTNLLFVLFSLPVVTIGACFSAMDYTLMKMPDLAVPGAGDQLVPPVPGRGGAVPGRLVYAGQGRRGCERLHQCAHLHL